MKIDCTHPMRAHVLADYLRRNEIPALVINEMDTVLGYGIHPTSVFFPDSFSGAAAKLLEAETPTLPDDPEYVFEDGVAPRKIGPLEFECGLGHFIWLIALVFLLVAVFTALTVIGDVLGWSLFWG